MAFHYILSACSGIYKIEILSIDSSVMKDIQSIEQQSWHKNLDFVKYLSYFTVKYKRENTNADKIRKK